jgi:hypothetical protein
VGFWNPTFYSSPIENEGTLHQRISYACQTNRKGIWAFASARQSMIRSVRVFIGAGGGNFEYFL